MVYCAWAKKNPEQMLPGLDTEPIKLFFNSGIVDETNCDFS
jgi:hypothetical protein